MVSEVSYEVSFDFGLVTSVGQGKLLSKFVERGFRVKIGQKERD